MGGEIKRELGTPQGGVVSPVLANLYLHEAFDIWMKKEFPRVQFERYADDIVIHCYSEKQADDMKGIISERLKQYKLELHPEKTRVIYTGTSNDFDDRGHKLSRKFTFLGYDFKPRLSKGGKLVFSPGIGRGALKMIRIKIKGWSLSKRISVPLADIARDTDKVIRGWINYYGYHRRSELYKLSYMIDNYLVSFIKRKYSKRGKSWTRAWEELEKLKKEQPSLFSHWHMIGQGVRRAV